MRSKNERLMFDIKRYIEWYYGRHGLMPSVRDIAAVVGCGKSSVHSYITELEERGILRRGADGPHTDVTAKTSFETVAVARVGSIPCGPLWEEEENIEEYIPLPVSVVGRGELYLLTASGDSMVGAGIDDGDLVLIRQQSEARDGDIVVALVGSEVTLKRLYRDEAHGRVVLHPENDRYEDIVAPDCIIQGVAVNVIKRLTAR